VGDTALMRAIVLNGPRQALEARLIPEPQPAPGEVLLRVSACGVCRTDLHIVDGELTEPKLPLVLGHQIVGVVERAGSYSSRFAPGTRVGVPWLASTCGACDFCKTGRENLCDLARFTGYHVDGGFAEYAVADERFCFALPEDYGDVEVAPLLCAGLIGYRSLRMAGQAERIGLYGFGAAAHIITQVARFEGRRVFAFVRPGDTQAERFALEMGASWAGGSDALPPEPLDAAILFAAVGDLVPAALRAVRKGGVVVCGGIHMSAIPSFPYELLWGERVIRSVANLTRRDGDELFALAGRVRIRTQVASYALDAANEALADLRAGRLRGAAVLTI
jgi:propanol-preferring alcohol dehydrogenase